MPLCLYLCCGDGYSAAYFRDAGYDVVGYDVQTFPDWPGQLIIQDVRELDGTAWRGKVDLLLASPPCTEFSRHDLPWVDKRGLPPPDMSLVEACFRLRDEINPRLFVLENVRGLQKFIGPATVVRYPYYLWGDLVLLPRFKHRKGNRRPRSIMRSRWPEALAKALASQLALTSPHPNT